ncbi:MAG: hypothetical protein M3464_08105 [Chloroflexota bacterium]|nr:hypothetical protein [Chloroflexota bacterium]
MTGCVDDEAERQFANDPRQSAALPTTIPTWPVPSPPAASPAASPVSAEQLLRTRGAAGRFYFLGAGNVWTLAPNDGGLGSVFEPPAEASIRAIASSPSGDRVAVIVVRPVDGAETADLLVLTLSGEELHRFEGIGGLAPGSNAEVVSLDWSPQGDNLLVALSPGGLVAVSLAEDAEPELIVAGGVAARPEQAAWSPTGEEVGFLAETGDDRTSIYVAAVATPTDPAPLFPDDVAMHTIFDWAWLPDGRALIFSEERGLTATADLWRINSDGSDRELVASAGSVAPVARIVGATPSRDGRSVAYRVVIPGDAGEAFDSLWVRDLLTNRGFELEVPAGQSVTDVWWTDAGLMFRVVPSAGYTGEYVDGPFAIYQVSDGTTATVIHQDGMSPSATPAATPLDPRL